VETGRRNMTVKSDNNITIHSKKRLSVQVSLTGLSFLVTAIDTGGILFFHEQHFATPNSPEEILVSLQDTLSTKDELTQGVASVSLTYATDIYTVVPAALFKEEKASEYLKFNSKILANDYIASDLVESYDLVVVFVPFMNINNYLFDTFGSFEYYHNASLLLKHILDLEKFNKSEKLYLHLQKEHVDCIALQNEEIQLCNTFPYKTNEDLLYYVLFCLEQLKLNPDKIEVVCLGMIDEEDEKFETLYKYIRNLSIFDGSNLDFPKIDNQRPHNHIPLKAIS